MALGETLRPFEASNVLKVSPRFYLELQENAMHWGTVPLPDYNRVFFKPSLEDSAY